MKKRKRILVIGGSGAVGSAICKSLVQEESHVVFTYFSGEEKAKALAQDLNILPPLFLDLRKYDHVQKIVQEAVTTLGGLDCLIQAGGIVGNSKFYEGDSRSNFLKKITCQDFDEIMNINARGTLSACQKASEFLRENGGGNIIILGSMDGVKAIPSPVHFAMSKSALKGMIEAMSKDLGKDNICVNLICPGILEGGASRFLTDHMKENYLKYCALERFGTMEEVADLATWLALENTYLTAQSILLEGGL